MVQLLTSLTVGFTLLHVKGLIPDRILAGCTLETLNMVSHLQCMHDFLIGGGRKRLTFLKNFETAVLILLDTTEARTPMIFFLHLAQFGAYRLSWHLVQ